jgi:hypothetical protein
MDAVPLKRLINGTQAAGTAPRSPGLIPTDDTQLTIAALHQGNYATISNYLERELRYMDAGE